MISEFDKDGDGAISFEDFEGMIDYDDELC